MNLKQQSFITTCVQLACELAEFHVSALFWQQNLSSKSSEATRRIKCIQFCLATPKALAHKVSQLRRLVPGSGICSGKALASN